MIGGRLFVLAVLSNCVLSLPLTPSQLENEDVKVMKCIVEALADVLSRPHPLPVSQECLVTLKTDDRLVSILRHHNFLRELQEIALEGGQERAQLQRELTTRTPETASDIPDQSMLEALGGPGEKSILSQKRRMGNGDREEEKHESLGDEEVQVKRENDKRPESQGCHRSENESSEGRAERREEEEKRENSEEYVTKDKKGAGSGEMRDAPRSKSKEKKFDEEGEDEKDKMSARFLYKQEDNHEGEEDEGEKKRGSKEILTRWTKRGKALPLKKSTVRKEAQQLSSQQGVPHHSKEVSEEEEEEEEEDKEKEKEKERNLQRSPEEKQLQMIAVRGHEEKRGSEEEGSASHKSEDQDIESLAAIESELENVAQKLHELRRG